MPVIEKRPVKVAVVGGGASGLTAAMAARYGGAEVVILERKDRVGKKILATGNGRCNLSNLDLSVSHYHGSNPKFVFGVLNRFHFDETKNLFQRLGIHWKVEEGGKIFPLSGQASSVLDVIRHELHVLGVKTAVDAHVRGLAGKEGRFILHLESGEQIKADRVIVATGGKAAPNLGSNGSGYELARQVGHEIIEPFPALVQLKLNASFLKQIAGVKFNGEVEIGTGEKLRDRAGGEILFTNYGISGPPVLALSRKAGELLRHGENVVLKVAILNDFSREGLEDLLVKRLQQQAHKDLEFSFVGLINKRLIRVLLKEAGIENINKPAAQVTARERSAMVDILLDWRFKVTGTTSWPAAQVTAGGVDVKDINPKTMESKLLPGLYFAGEVLDIDGDCGGYNLQWAWSSGYVAGESAAAKPMKKTVKCC